jgi:hypothetical protein
MKEKEQVEEEERRGGCFWEERRGGWRRVEQGEGGPLQSLIKLYW